MLHKPREARTSSRATFRTAAGLGARSLSEENVTNGSCPGGQLHTGLPQSVKCASSCLAAVPRRPRSLRCPCGRRPGLPVWARGGRIAAQPSRRRPCPCPCPCPAVRWWVARPAAGGGPAAASCRRRARIRGVGVPVRECVSGAACVSGRGFRLLPCRRGSRWKSM